MSRIKAREICFKLIFEHEFLKQKNEKSFEEFLAEQEDVEEKDIVYINNIYLGVMEKNSELEEEISKYLKNYSLQRIFKVDMALLKLAIYEISYMKESPKIVINEVVELAKKFSTDNSYKFINGVLANFAKGE